MTDLGSITPCYTIRFRRHTGHSPKRLWAAITVAEEIASWRGYAAAVDLRPGGDYRVDSCEDDGVIVRVEPGVRLTYVWGLSVVEWRLDAAADGGCDYTFVHSGLADRGEDEDGLAAGWHEFLDRLED